MDNKQYNINSRNNYFLGKLMTARDFFAEQEYFNSKRRFNNKFMFGPGIVAGMNIFMVDHKTFSLEPGMAIDYYGREIVVPNTCIRKLDLVENFDEFKSKSTIFLCIRYNESLDESTFSIVNQNSSLEKKQFNRIKEKFELFITDKEPDKLNLKSEGLFFQTIEIYNDNGIKLYGKFPKYVNVGQRTKVEIFFEKVNIGDPVYFNLKISGILFEDEATVSYDETDILTYRNISKICYLNCNANDESVSNFIISKDDFVIRIGMKEFSLKEDIKINFNATKKSVKNVLIDNYYSTNFENLLENNDEKFIYLAEMNIAISEIGYTIENFKKIPANQYILNTDLLRLINEIEIENIQNNLTSDKDKRKENDTVEDTKIIPKQTEQLEEKDNILSGVETINLGFKPKPGKVYYSYEFVHGLGPGNILVDTAIVNEANEELEEKNLLIFGDRSIFGADEVNLSVPDVQVACLVDPSKGTMRLGLRLEDRTNAQSVKIRWWAMKAKDNPSEKDNLVINDNLQIVISPDSATISPLAQVRFSAKIIGTDNQKISWSLGNLNPGKIDANGLYTAPAAEGIFEVIAQAVNFENLQTSAYVIVTSGFEND